MGVIASYCEEGKVEMQGAAVTPLAKRLLSTVQTAPMVCSKLMQLSREQLLLTSLVSLVEFTFIFADAEIII